MPRIGTHVSIAGGVANAPKRAHDEGCEVMQIFVQSPQTFATPTTTEEEIKSFQDARKKEHISRVYVHAPYLINLASENNRTRHGSINLIRKNLERASALQCRALMTHLGSYGEGDRETGMKRVISSLGKIFEKHTGKCMLLLELSAGSGNIVGSRFEEIHKILTALQRHRLGVCLDTAHIFASGYDLIGKKEIDATIKEFNDTIGLKYLQLIHCNDSLVPFGSKKDRHADLGDGKIGVENLALLMNHPKLKDIDFILETPGDQKRRVKDVAFLKSVRKYSNEHK